MATDFLDVIMAIMSLAVLMPSLVALVPIGAIIQPTSTVIAQGKDRRISVYLTRMAHVSKNQINLNQNKNPRLKRAGAAGLRIKKGEVISILAADVC